MSRYGTVGLEVVLSVVVGLVVGRLLDERLGTGGWLTLLGAVYGVAAGVRALYRAAQQATREAEEHDLREREERRKYRDGKRD
jgi:F0F1-type ATP synthase assembly protein I